MMPCCVAGALFIFQIMAFIRWFQRVILRRKPKEDEEDIWVPQRVKLRDRIKTIFSDPKRKKLTIAFIAVEVVLFIIIWMLGGFEGIGNIIEAISANPESSLENIHKSCH